MSTQTLPLQPDNKEPINITLDAIEMPAAKPVAPVPAPVQTSNEAAPKKKNLPAHFLVTVRGQAAITGGSNPQSVLYEETVACPVLGEGKTDGHYATHVLKDNDFGESLLAKAIRKKYGHCEAIRTHEVTSRVYVDANGNKTEAKNATVVNGQQFLQVSQMRYSELVAYVQERGYSIELDLYTSADELRMAIDSYEQDKDAFLVQQEVTREEVRIKRESEALEALNEDNSKLDI